MNHRNILALAAAATAAAVLTGAPAAVAGEVTRVAGPLTTYDAALAPAGATARVHAVEAGEGDNQKTIVTLHVKGLVPNREYGAHAHNLPCGALGSAAGAHYQYVIDPATGGDPKKASIDPAYANPENEIWLDFTTNASGSAHAKAVVDWQMPDERRAASVVIHVRHTDHTGSAGARVACISVPF